MLLPIRQFFLLHNRKGFHVLSTYKRANKLFNNDIGNRKIIQKRNIFGAATVLRSVLKLRYWVIGGTVGGGIHMNNKYNEWKESLPNFDWIKDFIPKEKKEQIKTNLMDLRDKAMAQDYFGKIATNANNTMERFREMLRERQKRQQESSSEAAAIISMHQDDVDKSNSIVKDVKNLIAEVRNSPNVDISAKETAHERIRKLQEELIEIQSKYQREIERLEKDNKDLRQSLLLKTDNSTSERLKKVNKTLIDLYSEVLDEMNDFDSNYKTQDHLPRVIVVGDQSAGKTSVLEMIAQARIFPRGAGEMMTRSPVKVTLKEGPYHIAKFKDGKREYDLSKEEDLAELRRDIEIRMKSKVKNGQSVSKDVIALTVEGPGIPRMVLVDLPGVISTVTTEMAFDTKSAIEDISMSYMKNPNAIILCIQDGSVDAERSIVTDLVSSVDPHGKRTIFVMTKMDLAEKNLANPRRVKKILDGKLFPMKALGYFAVVTGRGAKDETITSIRKYEEDFFKNSKLCQQGFLNTSQCTTQSLSLAVSDCFWRMVKSSVEQQADLYKARKFNLETKWKNTFANFRELDRDELFEIGKNQILDQIIKISHLTADFWEKLLYSELNTHLQDYIFEQIYLPAAKKPDSFNIHADITLKNWIDHILPEKTVEVGWKVLSEQFIDILKKEIDDGSGKLSPESDTVLFRKLKETIANDVLKQHTWDSKAFDVLRLIQMNASEDRMIMQREAWKESVNYLKKLVSQRIKRSQARLDQLVGPGMWSQWMYWQTKSREQFVNSNIRSELEKIFAQNAQIPKVKIDSEDLLLVKKNLRHMKIEVSDKDIEKVYKEMHDNLFLKSLHSKAQQCEKLYGLHLYKMDADISCDDIVFFYRIHHIVQASSKALRQQITNIEVQRLNKELKDALDDLNQNQEKKADLLSGKRLSLAEELKRVRQIQDKLEEFISALNKEK